MESAGDWNSLVGLVIKLRAENSRNGGSVTDRDKKLISYSKQYSGLWGPASILFSWYPTALRLGKANPNLCRVKKYLKETPTPPKGFILCTETASSLSTINPTWSGVGLKQVLWGDNSVTDYTNCAITGP